MSPIAVCGICGAEKTQSQMMPGALVRSGVVEEIHKAHPDWAGAGYICLKDLNHFRMQYVENLLAAEKGALTDSDRQVLTSLKQHETLACDIDARSAAATSMGERLADRLTDFVGSWMFLLVFLAVMLAWVGVNSWVLIIRPFDPYPYIFLNLVLSCMAAVQAPVIMMSQNRQDTRDRLRAEQDYRLNLKNELQLRHLHDRLDHLLPRQWERLVEIHQIQIDMLAEFSRLRDGDKEGGLA
jgi:uncharacterized membrane protein